MYEIGYLACYLLLQEGNELNIMLVNTLQKVRGLHVSWTSGVEWSGVD